jgi:hypothetical protein
MHREATTKFLTVLYNQDALTHFRGMDGVCFLDGQAELKLRGAATKQ